VKYVQTLFCAIGDHEALVMPFLIEIARHLTYCCFVYVKHTLNFDWFRPLFVRPMRGRDHRHAQTNPRNPPCLVSFRSRALVHIVHRVAVHALPSL
jgi:hypothetical protein